jgi:Protein of unknown function (DUF2867)
MQYVQNIEAFRKITDGADHCDVKTVESKVDLEDFIEGMFRFPKWFDFLLYVRLILVKLLRLNKHSREEIVYNLTSVPMVPGEKYWAFTLVAVESNSYWVGVTPPDKHLTAYLGIAIEPLKGELKRYHVLTSVYYKHWTGPVYFNIIRPFHHLVVRAMALNGAKGK